MQSKKSQQEQTQRILPELNLLSRKNTSKYMEYLFENANLVRKDEEAKRKFMSKYAFAGLFVFTFILVFWLIMNGLYRKVFWKVYYFPMDSVSWYVITKPEDVPVRFLFTAEKGQYVKYSPLPGYYSLEDWFYRSIFEPAFGFFHNLIRIAPFNPYELQPIIVFVTEDYRSLGEISAVLDTAVRMALINKYESIHPTGGGGKKTRTPINDTLYIYEYLYKKKPGSASMEYNCDLKDVIEKHRDIFDRNGIGVYELNPEDYLFLEKGRRYLYFVPRSDVYIQSIFVKWEVVTEKIGGSKSVLKNLWALAKYLLDLTEKKWVRREYGHLYWVFQPKPDKDKVHRFFVTDKIVVNSRIVTRI